jgi:hypothetical protein
MCFFVGTSHDWDFVWLMQVAMGVKLAELVHHTFTYSVSSVRASISSGNITRAQGGSELCMYQLCISPSFHHFIRCYPDVDVHQTQATKAASGTHRAPGEIPACRSQNSGQRLEVSGMQTSSRSISHRSIFFFVLTLSGAVEPVGVSLRTLGQVHGSDNPTVEHMGSRPSQL